MMLQNLQFCERLFGRWLGRLSLLAAVLLMGQSAEAQINMKWAESSTGVSTPVDMATDETDITWAVAMDDSSNTYIVGISEDDSDPLNPYTEEYQPTNRFFLGKYNSIGELVWQVPITISYGTWTGTFELFCGLNKNGKSNTCAKDIRPYARPAAGQAIAVDETGVYVAFNIHSGDPNVAGVTLSAGEALGFPQVINSANNSNRVRGIIIKYTTDGFLAERTLGGVTVNWVKYLETRASGQPSLTVNNIDGVSTPFMELTGIENGEDDDIVAVGSYYGIVDMETDVASAVGEVGRTPTAWSGGTVTASKYYYSGYISRYNNISANWQWTASIGAYSRHIISPESGNTTLLGFPVCGFTNDVYDPYLDFYDVDTDNGNIYVSGTLRGSIGVLTYKNSSHTNMGSISPEVYFVSDEFMNETNWAVIDSALVQGFYSESFPLSSSTYTSNIVTGSSASITGFGSYSCNYSTSARTYYNSDAVLFQVDPDGLVQWGKKWGDAAGGSTYYGNEQGGAVLAENGDLFIVVEGDYEDVSFGTSPTPISVYATSYIVKLYTSAENRVHWVHPLSNISPIELSYSDDQMLHAAGQIYGIGDIYYEPYDGNNTPYRQNGAVTAVGGVDIIVMKMDKVGTRQWETTIGGTGNESAFDIATYEDDFVIGGYYEDVVDFQPSPTVNFLMTGNLKEDAFVARYGCYEVTLVADQDTVCEGTPVTIIAESECPSCDYSYAWTTASGSQTTSSATFFSSGAVGTNTIYVVATDSRSGCVSEAFVEILVNPAVSVIASPATVLLCDGSPSIFTAVPTPNNATVNWYYFDTSNLVQANTTILTTSTAGAYIVEAEAAGCYGYANVVFNQYPELEPVLLPSAPSICAGGTAPIQVVGCPGCSYAWTVPIGSSTSSLSNSIQADVSGMYNVIMVDANGCTYDLSATVGNSPSLVPPIWAEDVYGNATNSVCNGDPVIIRTASCPGCSYQWSDGSVAPFTVSFGTGSYQVTVVDNLNNCAGTSQNVAVNVAAVQEPTLVSEPSCNSGQGTITVTNPCNQCVYTWYNNDGSTPGGIGGITIPVFTTVTPGDYYVVVEDTNSCTETSLVGSIIGLTSSAPIISSNTNVLCGNNFATLTTTACTGCTYQWYSTGGATDTLILGATSNTYTTNLPRNYKVEVTYANGCVNKSTAYAITLSPPPVLDAEALSPTHSTICNGTPVLVGLNAGTYLYPPDWSYQWYYEGSLVTGATGFNIDAYSPGAYYVVVVNDLGCTITSDTALVTFSNVGANPLAVASPQFVCPKSVGYTTATLSVGTCTGCTYQWVDGSTNLDIPSATNPTETTVFPGIAYVNVSTPSGCVYSSNVVEVLDSVLAKPVIQVSSSPICSSTPVVLSVPACPGCTYVWMTQDSLLALDTVQIGPQNTYAAIVTGNYLVELITADTCASTSNVRRVTFATVNALLQTPSSTTICNSVPIALNAIPNAAVCVGCTYEWFRNGSQLTNTTDFINVTQGGSYYTVITNNVGCADTSSSITFINEALSTGIISSAVGICDTNYVVPLSVPSCVGCTYQWYLNGFPIAAPVGNTDTLNVIGYAAVGTYTVAVDKNGCVAIDSIEMDILLPRFTFNVSATPSHGSICNGSPVLMSSDCATCTHQWLVDNIAQSAPLGTLPSFLTDSSGAYMVYATDTNGCVQASPIINLIEVDPPFNFALDFDTLSILPISYGILDMTDYLTPTTIHPNSVSIDTGYFASFTANNAMSGLGGALLDPSLAGPGIHIIQYTYSQSNCTFSTRDTIQILEPISIALSNSDPNAPLYEACVGDLVTIHFNNFTFAPTQIILSAGGSDTILMPITPTLTYLGGVWNGQVTIVIPSDAKTGKVTATNGTTSFQTDFFLVVRNPEATISLNGVPTPLCSNGGLITLVGTPSGGLFRAAYLSAPTTYVGALVSGSDLVMDNVANYDLNGDQQLRLSYWYAPTYTGTNYVCSDTLVAYVDADVRDVDLVSVEYTPVSLTQTEEAMEKLTRVVWPLQTRFYENHYTGTYISNDTILPSTITGGWGNEPITYQVVNDGCTNTHVDSLMIWPRPNMNPIPKYICREDTIIYIGRNSSGIYYVVGGINSGNQDPLYIYQFNNISSGVDFAYIEQINLMEVTSSNGGLTPINLANGSELYALDPATIAGSSTELTIRFKYNRNHFYFTPSNSNSTTEYVIAEISKTVFVEEPVTALISPSIIADPVFCQDNTTMQFSGSPIGGQYFLNDSLLTNNIFNPSYHAVGNHDLKYVYSGYACKDSMEIQIFIPTPFSISVFPPTGPEYCVNDGNDTIGFIVSGISAGAIDSTSGLFYVGGILSGSIFAPSQRLPGTYPVVYAISDTFGCQESALDTFIVHDIPQISMTTFNPTYCLNSGNIPIQLFHGAADISTGGLYPSGGSAILSAGGLIGGTPQNNPANPIYEPVVNGVGMDTIIYTYTDTNICTNSMRQIFEIYPLPVLSIATTGGAPVGAQYCEGSIVPLFGSPTGGQFDSVSTTNLNEYNLNPSNNTFVAFISDNFTATAIEVFQYAYTDPTTGCRDTVLEDIEVLNYTVAIDIQGLNPTFCAYDSDISLTANQTIYTGGGIAGGTFSSTIPSGLYQAATPSFNALFYPDTLGIVDFGSQVIVRFDYMDGLCPNYVMDTTFVHPVPQLTYDLPGDRLLNSISTQQHICIAFAPEPIRVYNLYQGVTSNVTTAGAYLSGQGVVIPNGTSYSPNQAGPGMDVISFTYTDLNGCISVITDSVAVDTVPPLDLVGYPVGIQGDGSAALPYTYCANDIGHLVIPSPFGGQMYFNTNTAVVGNVFDLQPSQLAAPIYADTTHRLSYIYISARYLDGRVCKDSIADTILIHPTPVIQLALSVPDEICVGRDTVELLDLDASPIGGVFEDITPGNIPNGIIQDTFFNATAQLGDREILYWYADPITGCSDSVQHTIAVHRIPHVGFSTGGGCVGTVVQFNPDTTFLVDVFPAMDSLTDVTWDFGDGTIVPVTNLTNPIVVPNISHTYAAAGIYFPKLTLSNRGHCDTSFTSRVVISPHVTVSANAEYFEEFEDGTGGWMQEEGNAIGVPQDTAWEWGFAGGQRINTVFFEDNVWVTRRDVAYKKGENAWVYSPCFDITDLERPMISLDIWRDSRQGVDGTVLEYFDNVSQSWLPLGFRGKGINWFTPQFVIAAPGDQTAEPIGWSGVSNGWENARYRLDAPYHDLRSRTDVRFRMAFESSPNTVVNGLEGFAFDDVRIRNRDRNVLVEHFTNQYHPGIEDVEPALYSMIYSNLYGRDVSLIQYHTSYDNEDDDEVYQYNIAESNARVLYYGITENNQVRLDGKNLVNTTSELIYYQQDLIDEEMLADPKFEINFISAPQFVFSGNQLNVEVEVIALEDMPAGEYTVQVVMTEDSVENNDEDYPMMSVMRNMLDDATGTEFNQSWAAGDVQSVQFTRTIDASVVNPTQCELVIFVQNVNTREVFQVATTRNLTIYQGPIWGTGTTEVEGDDIVTMNLYPNPADNHFFVEFSQPLETENEWRLVDMAGRVLQDGVLEKGDQFLRVYTEQLAGGMYIFSVRNDNVYTQRKVIIAK